MASNSVAIGNPGGVKAPSGRRVAGQRVRERRQQPRRTPRAPRRGGGGERYNALESPYKTRAQFNQAVAQNAKTQYEPQLKSLETEEQGETGLHQAREGENTRIYNQYSQQAQESFDQAKAALGEVAARSNASTQAGQQTLQAALSNTGIAGLAGVTNPDAFMNEATGLGNMASQTLAGEQSGILGEAAKEKLVPGAFRSEAQSQEGQRYGGALGKLAKERRDVRTEIPSILAKTRSDMNTTEQNREANRLQSALAGKKFGLEKAEGKAKIGLERAGLRQKREEAREANDLKYEELQQNAGIETKKLKLEGERLHKEADEKKEGKQKAAAELRAKRWDNGVSIMNNYLKLDEKQEFNPTGEPIKDKQSEAEGKRPKRRNAMELYKALTVQANMTAPEAFRLMRSAGGYFEVFANKHEREYNAHLRVGTNKRGAPVEYRTPQEAARHGHK